jgi:hypothetical protein
MKIVFASYSGTIFIPNYSMYLPYLAGSITKRALCFHNISAHNIGPFRCITSQPLHPLFVHVYTNIKLLEAITQLYGGFYFHANKSIKRQACDFYI